jgi:hypothetical protein
MESIDTHSMVTWQTKEGKISMPGFKLLLCVVTTRVTISNVIAQVQHSSLVARAEMNGMILVESAVIVLGRHCIKSNN